ncbi:MAG: ATP-binding protein [Terracidiphilus sp.]
MAANTEIYGGTQPSGCITAAGDVWFPGNLGPIHVLPFERSTLPPPPLRIQSVLADGVTVPPIEPIVLQPGNRRLQLSFAAIQLRSQDDVRFRYMLEGFEKKWSAPTSARTADYTNLSTGRYRFRVRAFEVSSPDAVTETSIAVRQLPFFYRTWWFMTACALLAILSIYAVYQYRVRQVRARAEAVLEERSRVAREMHDTVIQGCTGVFALLEALAMEAAKVGQDGGLMEFARMQLRTTIDEARDAIWNLRKSDGEADRLGGNLESMALQAGDEFHLPVSWSMSGSPFGVSPPVAHDLLMVAREAVYNSVLHGRPGRVDVALAYRNRELILLLADDGCGFDMRAVEASNGRHFGLKGMRERIERSGGRFRLTTAIGKGVHIEVRLPRRR